jgi:hypothetical protein
MFHYVINERSKQQVYNLILMTFFQFPAEARLLSSPKRPDWLVELPSFLLKGYRDIIPTR